MIAVKFSGEAEFGSASIKLIITITGPIILSIDRPDARRAAPTAIAWVSAPEKIRTGTAPSSKNPPRLPGGKSARSLERFLHRLGGSWAMWIYIPVPQIDGGFDNGLLDSLPFRKPFQPWAPWSVLFLVSILLLTNDFRVFFFPRPGNGSELPRRIHRTPEYDRQTLRRTGSVVTCIPVFLALYLGYESTTPQAMLSSRGRTGAHNQGRSSRRGVAHGAYKGRFTGSIRRRASKKWTSSRRRTSRPSRRIGCRSSSSDWRERNG
jgi:hypothetical protein